MEQWITTQSLLITLAFDLANDMDSASDYGALDGDVSLMDKLTTIIKRMGETVVLSAPVSEDNEPSSDTQTQEQEEGEE